MIETLMAVGREGLAPAQALYLTGLLWGLSGLVQCIEFLRLDGALSATGLWTWTIQRDEFAGLPGPLRALLDALFGARLWRAHLLLRALAMLALIVIGPTTGLVSFLLAGTVLILLRWRGAFNGGSDFMTLAVIGGLFISQVAQPWVGPDLATRAGLVWIAIQALSSYFLSGAVKLVYAGWREGRALPVLLDTGLHGPLPADSPYRRRPIAIVVSWLFIVWETAAPLALLDPRVALLWCLPALVFHLLVYRYFGLNRFVWAWAASLPAIVATAGLAGP